MSNMDEFDVSNISHKVTPHGMSQSEVKISLHSSPQHSRQKFENSHIFTDHHAESISHQQPRKYKIFSAEEFDEKNIKFRVPEMKDYYVESKRQQLLMSQLPLNQTLRFERPQDHKSKDNAIQVKEPTPINQKDRFQQDSKINQQLNKNRYLMMLSIGGVILLIVAWYFR